MKIDYLANHLWAIPIIAKWNHEEWGASRENSSVEMMATKYAATANKDNIPFTLIALDDENHVQGCVSVIACDMESRCDLTPWLAALYVAKEHRKKGIGAALIKRLEQEVKRIGVKVLYLYTTKDSNIRLYEKRGWVILERASNRGEEVTIMEHPLS